MTPAQQREKVLRDFVEGVAAESCKCGCGKPRNIGFSVPARKALAAADAIPDAPCAPSTPTSAVANEARAVDGAAVSCVCRVPRVGQVWLDNDDRSKTVTIVCIDAAATSYPIEFRWDGDGLLGNWEMSMDGFTPIECMESFR